VMGLVNAKGEARSPIATMFLGERWTAAQEKAINEGLAAVGKARLTFTAVARRELGTEEADLLAGTTRAAQEGNQANEQQRP
jgi:hypothetical protein